MSRFSHCICMIIIKTRSSGGASRHYYYPDGAIWILESNFVNNSCSINTNGAKSKLFELNEDTSPSLTGAWGASVVSQLPKEFAV